MKAGAGTKEDLVNLFGSTSRARILIFLFAHIGQSFYQREIMFETGFSLQAIQRELINLVDLGIVQNVPTPNRIYYRVNSASPYFKPLREICHVAPRGNKSEA